MAVNQALSDLREALDAIEAIYELPNGNEAFLEWREKLRATIAVAFGSASDQMKRFDSYTFCSWSANASNWDDHRAYQEDLRHAKALLKGMIHQVERSSAPVSSPTEPGNTKSGGAPSGAESLRERRARKFERDRERLRAELNSRGILDSGLAQRELADLEQEFRNDMADLEAAERPAAQAPPQPEHEQFMTRAIEQARRCEGEDGDENPKVGVVVVLDGRVVVEARRGELRPGDHAEYTALESKAANEPLAGATVYCTLEPCTTRSAKKTPCADRLIARRVRTVFIGMLDPDRRIRGEGVKRLRKAGIEVQFFPRDMMARVEELNRNFEAHCESQNNRVERIIQQHLRPGAVDALEPEPAE